MSCYGTYGTNINTAWNCVDRIVSNVNIDENIQSFGSEILNVKKWLAQIPNSKWALV